MSEAETIIRVYMQNPYSQSIWELLGPTTLMDQTNIYAVSQYAQNYFHSSQIMLQSASSNLTDAQILEIVESAELAFKATKDKATSLGLVFRFYNPLNI